MNRDGTNRQILTEEGWGAQWSPNGKRFAFLNIADDGIELWVGETKSGKAHRIPDLKVNPILGSELIWMPDQRTLLVKRIPKSRGAEPRSERDWI